MRRLPFALYNLGPSGDRPARQMRREVRALLRERDDRGRRRKVVAVVEAVGWRLPRSLTHNRARNTTTPGRANVAIYVRRGLRMSSAVWRPHSRDWPRVLHPGRHPPRATLVIAVEDWLVIVGHAPQAPLPKFGRDVNDQLNDARSEWLTIVAAEMNRARCPVLLLADTNGLDEDLLRRLPPEAAKGGTNVESAHVVGAVLDDARKVSAVNGVPMRSDHRGALVGKARRR